MLVSFADGPLPQHVKKTPISGLAPFDAGAGAYPRPRPALNHRPTELGLIKGFTNESNRLIYAP